jgi:Fic family protein
MVHGTNLMSAGEKMSQLENSSESNQPPYLVDPRKADAGYRPFPSFEEWRRDAEIDASRWERYASRLELRKDVSPEVLRHAKELVELATAVDTGAIEGLYEADRGFTFTVATQAAIWQAVVEEKKGHQVRSLIESQLKAYEYVVDLATQQVPIAEAWIRQLHEVICQNQDTYAAYTEIGVQDLPLPKGEYKHLPNHIIRKDGNIHSHAPVDLTPAEMYRFCQELRSDAFLDAHPAFQASYAHYAFVVIHPFADGNGRVARALASVFTYHSNSVPLVILTENKQEYFSSLLAADQGNYQPFVNFIFERGLDSISLFSESLRTASLQPAEEALAELKRLYVTKGGYSHVEVDEAGYKLFELLKQEFLRHKSDLSIQGLLSFNISSDQAHNDVINPAYRPPISQGMRRLHISLHTEPPAAASVSRTFFLEVPRDCGRDDDIVMREVSSSELFEARMTELIPVATAALQMRVSIAVQRIIRELISELKTKAGQNLIKG